MLFNGLNRNKNILDKKIIYSICSFRDKWNLNIIKKLNGYPEIPALEIYLKFKDLLKDDVLNIAKINWEKNKSIENAELFGFLLRHRMDYEFLIKNIDNPSCKEYDALCMKLIGYSLWNITHLLLGKDWKIVYEGSRSFLLKTDQIYWKMLNNLFNGEKATIKKLDEKLGSQLEKTFSNYSVEKILNIIHDIQNRLGILSSKVNIISHKNAVTPVVVPLKSNVNIYFDIIGGREDLRAMLHGIAHSHQYIASMHNPLINSLYSIVGSEIFAFLFQWLTVEDDFISNSEDVEWERLILIHIWRRQAALYIYHAHSSINNWNPNTDEYLKIMNWAICPGISSDFAYKDLDYRILSLQFLEAFESAAKLRNYLVYNFGRKWWKSYRAGKFLRNILKRGNYITYEEISKKYNIKEDKLLFFA